jgi:hypothetical protein
LHRILDFPQLKETRILSLNNQNFTDSSMNGKIFNEYFKKNASTKNISTIEKFQLTNSFKPVKFESVVSKKWSL